MHPTVLSIVIFGALLAFIIVTISLDISKTFKSKKESVENLKWPILALGLFIMISLFVAYLILISNYVFHTSSSSSSYTPSYYSNDNNIVSLYRLDMHRGYAFMWVVLFMIILAYGILMLLVSLSLKEEMKENECIDGNFILATSIVFIAFGVVCGLYLFVAAIRASPSPTSFIY